MYLQKKCISYKQAELLHFFSKQSTVFYEPVYCTSLQVAVIFSCVCYIAQQEFPTKILLDLRLPKL